MRVVPVVGSDCNGCNGCAGILRVVPIVPTVEFRQRGMMPIRNGDLSNHSNSAKPAKPAKPAGSANPIEIGESAECGISLAREPTLIYA